MLRSKWMGCWVVVGFVTQIGGCGTEENGDDTTAMTVGMTSAPTSSADDGSGGDDDGADDGSGGGGSTAGDDDGMGSTAAADDTPTGCDPPCADGAMCVAGQCLGGGDSSGGGSDDCPDGEMCQMTGAGTMACLAEPDHCVKACGQAGLTCPEGMECMAGACQYNVMDLPTDMSDPDYPAPDATGMCPEGTFGPYAFAMGFAVCVPMCDGVGLMAACPGTGGVCAFSPNSSGTPC
jgi:hypothetical protein